MVGTTDSDQDTSNLEGAMDKTFTLREILEAMDSLYEPKPRTTDVAPSEYVRGQVELVGRLLLDQGGWGEGTAENGQLVAAHLELPF